MKDTPLSNSERDFLLKAIEEKKVRCAQLYSSEEGDAEEVHRGMQIEISPHLSLQRLDGRQTYDYRRIKVSFGADYGCCFVELGETR